MLINLRGDKGSTIQYTALTLKWPGLVYKVFCLLIIFQKCSYIIMGAWCCWLPDPDNVSCRLQLPSGAPPPRRALRHENIFIILYLFISRSKRMFRIFYSDTLSLSHLIKKKTQNRYIFHFTYLTYMQICEVGWKCQISIQTASGSSIVTAKTSMSVMFFIHTDFNYKCLPPPPVGYMRTDRMLSTSGFSEVVDSVR